MAFYYADQANIISVLLQRCLISGQTEQQTDYVSQDGAFIKWELAITPLPSTQEISDVQYNLITVTNSGQYLVKISSEILHQW